MSSVTQTGSSVPVAFGSDFWRKLVQESIDARREFDQRSFDLLIADDPELLVLHSARRARQDADVMRQLAELQREFAQLEPKNLVVVGHGTILSRLRRWIKRLPSAARIGVRT